MRALAAISAVILTGVSLAGCDMPGSHQQQVAVAPAPPPCNCGQAAVTPPPPEHLARFSYVPRHHYVRHHYYAAYSGPAHYRGGYTTDYAQSSVDSYDYVSSSRASYSESSYAEGGYSEGGYASGGRVVWVDGYGRGYFRNEHTTVAASMRGRRLAAYHGYDVDCPEDGEPR
jgi:hypothetical protein